MHSIIITGITNKRIQYDTIGLNITFLPAIRKLANFEVIKEIGVNKPFIKQTNSC